MMPDASRRWWRLSAGEHAALAVVLVVRVVVFTTARLLPPSVQNRLTPDSALYFRAARQVAYPELVAGVDNWFPVVVGHLMRWFDIPIPGPFELVGAVAAAGTVGVALALCALVRADLPTPTPGAPGSADRRWLILVVGLYPSAVMFSSVGFIRDGWIYVLSLGTVTLIASALWSRPRVRVAPLVGLVPVAAALGALRMYAVASVGVGLVLWVLWERRVPVGRWLVPVRGVAVAGLVVAVAGYVVVRDHLDARLRSMQALAAYRASYFETGSTSNMNLDFRNASVPALAVRFGKSVVFNVIGPLPHQVNSLTLLVLAVEALALVVVGFWLWQRRRLLGPRGRFLIAQAVAWLLVIATFNDNLGTAARLRVPAWTWLLVVLASVRRGRVLPQVAQPARTAAVVVPLRGDARLP